MEDELRGIVTHLARGIGERNARRYDALCEAAGFLERSLAQAGHQVLRQSYEIAGKRFSNLEVEVRGHARPDEIVVVGAHYDTAPGSPGANDNGSSLAALLALARHFSGVSTPRTLRLVAFTNEEHPFTPTKQMGSRVYAMRCRERGEHVVGMLSLETIGYCSREPGSQKLSLGGRLLPTTGDFLALVANRPSRELLDRVYRSWQGHSRVTAQRVVLPTYFPGAWSSDHWSFWKAGYPALMLTDTAPLRYPHYHKPGDTPEQVQFGWLEQVTRGLIATVADLIAPAA